MPTWKKQPVAHAIVILGRVALTWYSRIGMEFRRGKIINLELEHDFLIIMFWEKCNWIHWILCNVYVNIEKKVIFCRWNWNILMYLWFYDKTGKRKKKKWHEIRNIFLTINFFTLFCIIFFFFISSIEDDCCSVFEIIS